VAAHPVGSRSGSSSHTAINGNGTMADFIGIFGDIGAATAGNSSNQQPPETSPVQSLDDLPMRSITPPGAGAGDFSGMFADGFNFDEVSDLLSWFPLTPLGHSPALGCGLPERSHSTGRRSLRVPQQPFTTVYESASGAVRGPFQLQPPIFSSSLTYRIRLAQISCPSASSLSTVTLCPGVVRRPRLTQLVRRFHPPG
jgi:hypothetical protein